MSTPDTYDFCEKCGCYNNDGVVCNECYVKEIEQLKAEIDTARAKAEAIQNEIAYVNGLLESQTKSLEKKCAEVIQLQLLLEQVKTERDDLINAILYAVDAGAIDDSSDVARQAVGILAGL